MTWHTEWITDAKWNTKESINAVFNSDYVITLDELPEDLYTVTPVTPDKLITGDVNLDGKVDVTDLSSLAIHLIDDTLTGDGLKMADVDHDGKVLLTDLARLRQYLVRYIESLD